MPHLVHKNLSSVLTLVSALQSLAQQCPDNRVYTWLVDGEREGSSLTYGELDGRARSLAWKLCSLQLRRMRALLLYGPGLDFVEALFGCLYAGIIAVPAYVPGSNRDHPRIQAILQDADCGIVLTDKISLTAVSGFLVSAGCSTPCLATDAEENPPAADWSAPPSSADQIAYLQYTSGSTATPKGVMITHANVIGNLKYIASQGGFDKSTVSVSWLPHFHDMGLIYGFLQPLFSGFPAVLFSPAAFLHRPLRWLSAISRYQGTHSGGPNFAYDQCVDRISANDCLQLDLNSWRVAFNGSEPVRKGTLERFAEYFAGSHFDRKSFYPVYGLAEASLKVTSGDPGAGATLCSVDAEQLQNHKVCWGRAEDKPVQTFVGCGRVGRSHEVIIVNPDTLESCAGDQVGEIWFSGPSVARGYWNNPSATEKTFQAVLKDGRGPYLRTGDLGFLHEHELFITGRLKDCIIVRGRNHYPQDIEKTVEECHAALRHNGGAAFSIEHSGQEVLVILSEVDRKYRGDLKSVVDTMRKAIAEVHELQAFAVVLIKAGSLAKTSSGKVQRRACKAKFLQDAFPILEKSILAPSDFDGSRTHITRNDILGESAASRLPCVTDYLKPLVARISHHGADEIELSQTLLSLGMDSLMLFDLKQRMEDDLHLAVPLAELLDGTLGQLAAWISEHIGQDVAENDGYPKMGPPAHCAVAPLSFSQEQVWLMQQLFPESCAYNESLVVRLTGSLDLPAIAKAMRDMVRRHEILRTHFDNIDGELRQQVQSLQPFDLPVSEIGGTSSLDVELQSIVHDEVQRPFQLDRDLPIRFRLIKASEQEHYFILVAHHIVCDGASLMIVVRELGALYQAYATGEGPPLPELRLQYADFAVWQRQWLQGETLNRQLAYWGEQLLGVPVLDLRPCELRPAMIRHQGGRVALQIPAGLTEKVKAMSRREGATLFMSILVAFQVLLSRYSGQQDFAVGTPVANRGRAGTHDLIGFFVNTIALRARLNSQLNFLQLLNQARRTAVEAYEHQDVPLTKLVEDLHPERDLSRPPLFQVMLVFQPSFEKELIFGNLRFSLLEIEVGAAKFDLTLRVVERDPGLQVFLEYSRDIFDAETIQRMANHFHLLLEEMVVSPERRIAEVSMLTEAERRQLLLEWNQTRIFHPAGCVHELFEDRVTRAPNVLAVECEGRQLTYGQLNRRANQLAHFLQKLGVGPEVRVGICVERSLEMTVGLLGILKAGAAYVPLDPGYPVERLAYILEDAGVAIVLSQSHLACKLSAHRSEPVFLDHWQQFDEEGEEEPLSTITSDNLAYVLYTSGSTGRPKGVMVSHGAFVNHLRWRQRVYPLSAEDRFLHKASLSFDIAGWEIFATLLAGARLIMAAPQRHQESAYLVRLMAEKNITMVHFSPAMLQAVLEECMIRNCRALKHVFCGGEIMSAGLATLFSSTLAANLHNQFGPTETTVDVLCWDCNGEQSSERSVPIGRPIDNTCAYILDSDLQPVPVGVAGELCIGGQPLARGYVNLAEMTADRFIPDPFHGAGARLFKTGDLARYRTDGSIEFLGRRDRQVKVRGFRIELEEIETVLLGHPAVREVALVVRQAGDGNLALVVYLVSDLPITELREYLKSKVPEYMVPGAWITLERLPRLPSGKVDMPALGKLQEETSCLEERPLTATEEVVATVWQQLLGINSVGPQGNFFDLGGHSVLCTRLVSRVREVFGVELPLRTVFEFPTLAALSGRVESARRSGGELKLPPIVAVARHQDLPLSFAQQQMWLLHQLERKSSVYNMAVALGLEGPLQVEALERAFSEIVRRHEVLRTRFPEREGRTVQEIVPPAPVRIPILDLQELFRGMKEEDRLQELQRLARDEAAQPFDLARGPLLRVQLLRSADKTHLLMFTMHHIAGDGWSTGILVRELAHLYQACTRGEKSRLPELELQYADFAVWQRQWLQGGLLETQLAYWREQLAGLEVLDLPADHVRPAIIRHHGGSVRFRIPLEITAKLKVLGRQENVTDFMTLMAAFQVLLSKYTGRNDIAVGTPVANRNRMEVEGLIGFFANTLVLRTDLTGNPSFLQLLKRVRQVTLDAYQHQDAPFEKLVEELSPQRELNRSPLFQVMLAMQNTGQPELQLPGLQVSEFETGSEAAKFDVLLTLWQRAESMEGKLVYARELYEQETMERMLGHWQRVLEKVVDEPAKPMSSVSLLDAQQREQIVVEWNRTHVMYRPECVQALFEEQVRRNPGQVAVEYEGRELTYEELNWRANQLGHYLRKMGAGPEVRVGICMERSMELVVGLLAILKAGAAYVPLDPQYPEERCRYILEDIQARVVLTGSAMARSLVGSGVKEICIEEEIGKVGEESVENLPIKTAPENLAYIIYTSGSTGKPKGVAITHASLSNHMNWMLERYPWSQGDAVLQKTSIGFDAAVWEFYAPLLSGGKLVLPLAGGHHDPGYLIGQIRSKKVTILQMVPSVLRLLLQEPEFRECKTLKYLFCGGEALTLDLVTQVWSQLKIEVINLYGPTEATIDAAYWSSRPAEIESVPIGRPVSNTQAYVLDEFLNPVPVGVVGELYLGGEGLARGYWNQPALSAGRFLPNPFSNQPGGRMYRTGDQVKWQRQGELEYLGRVDQQVKIRGVRIELGEIETVLRQQAGVKECIVVAREDQPGDKRLVAYVVNSAGHGQPLDLSSNRLRQSLKGELPEYMVPSDFVMLQALPLTTSGKLDRKALPKPERIGREDSRYLMPRNRDEEILCGIFAEVLTLEWVGIEDNFFELGGHSLLATQVISRVRNAFQVELPLQTMLEVPTVAGLSERIREFRCAMNV